MQGFASTASIRRRQPRRTSLLLLIQLLCLLEASLSFVIQSTLPRPCNNDACTTLFMAASKTGARLLKDQQEFDDLVLGDAKTPVMCFFTAPWCGPCRLSIPVVKESMKQFEKKISVYEICTDDAPDIAEGCGVLSIPTIQVYCKGELKETIVGCVAKSVLASAIEKVLEDTSKLFAVNGNADRQ